MSDSREQHSRLTINMTDAELNLWIAGKLEPFVSWNNHLFSYNRQFSDGNCWWRPIADALHDYEVQDKRPRDFCNDPACIVILIMKLPPECSTIDIEENGECSVFRYEDKLSRGRLGRAVAEAWVLANSWKV